MAGRPVPQPIGNAPGGPADRHTLAASLLQARADVAVAEAECRRLRGRNALLNRRLAEVSALLAERDEGRRRVLQAQKLEAIGDLTGGIAHDINNLLTVVSGGLYLLPGAVDDPARRERLIRRMTGAVDRGAEVTQRLLAFARRQLLRPEPIDLAGRAERLRLLLGPLLGSSVALGLLWQDGLWPIRADPAALDLALLNVAENARDAMPLGGSFTLTAANRTLCDAAAREALLADGDYVEITCADTGTGMAPEVQARAFEPFFTTKPIGQGSGLGLPQVHGFASQSGGAARLPVSAQDLLSRPLDQAWGMVSQYARASRRPEARDLDGTERA